MERIALEVVASWEGHVMAMELFVPGGGAYVVGGTGRCAFPLDEEALGGRETWTLIDEEGVILVPPSARQATWQRSSGPEPVRTARVRLSLGESLEMILGSVRFRIQGLPMPVKPRLPVEFNLGAFAWAVSGVALFAITLVLLWHAPRPVCQGDGICGFDPMGWVGEGGSPAPDPCAAQARSPRAPSDTPLSTAAGHGVGPGFGFGTIPITGGGQGSTVTGVPEGAMLVTEHELQGLFGYPVCIQEQDR